MILSSSISGRVKSCRPNLDGRCSRVVACAAQRTSANLGDQFKASISSALVAAALVAAPTFLTYQPEPAWASNAEVSRKAVEDYMDLEAKGKTTNAKALDDFRSKYRYRRTLDGRVQLKSSKGDWWSVRLDMEVPGALLLRDNSGNVYAVQTDNLQQIDLSDDYVCLLMFADGAWEEQAAPVDFSDDDGKVKQLKLNEKEFREVIGILKEAGDDGEE